MEFEPKSVCIPEHTEIDYYNECQFSGEKVTFDKSVPCFADYNPEVLVSKKNMKKLLSKNMKGGKQKKGWFNFNVRTLWFDFWS